MAEYTSPQTGTIHLDFQGRDFDSLSTLAKDRLKYQPRAPLILQNPSSVSVYSFLYVYCRLISMTKLPSGIVIGKYFSATSPTRFIILS